jgi:hypothetical protein
MPAPALAQTEKCIALLIGNKDYKAGVGSLTNPLNDIRIVGDALKSVGFELHLTLAFSHSQDPKQNLGTQERGLKI